MWLEQLGRDFRFSFRSLRRAPGFSIAVIVTLALCIGVNTSIMSVLYGLVLKPLPFRDSGQLVEIYNSQMKSGQPKKLTSVAQYLDFKASADLFEGFALWRDWTFTVGEETDPTRSLGLRTTADLFTFLGIQPLLGRFFTMEESTPGKDRVVVLTQSFWEKQYRGDPAVVGKVIRLGGESYTIIGVAPRRLESFNVYAIMLKPFEWVPQLANPQARAAYNANMYARVKSGIALTAGLAQLETLEKRFHETVAPPGLRDFLDRNGQRVALGQISVERTKSVKTSLLLLQGSALFVLFLGCLNVANLMLARANARQSELAVRQALGAGRRALAQQLLSESALLAMAGAAIGLALAWASLRIINTYTASIVREVQPVSLDGTLLGMTLLVSFVVALLIGLLPVVRIWRSNLIAAMRGGMRGASGGAGARAASSSLVMAQVALALILLVGASLLIRSFANVMAVNPGFDAKRIIHGRVAFNASYRDVASVQAVQDRIMAKMREIPGVEAVSYTSHMPINGGYTSYSLPIRGSVLGKEDTYPTGTWLGVSPDFFQTMGIRILEGRGFTVADTLPKARQVFIVDRRFAERYFPGRSAVGEMFGFAAPNQKPEDGPVIVGVAEVARLYGQEDRGQAPFVYGAMGAGGGGFSLEVRTARPLEDVARLMRAQLRSVDPTLPLYQINTLQQLTESTAVNEPNRRVRPRATGAA